MITLRSTLTAAMLLTILSLGGCQSVVDVVDNIDTNSYSTSRRTKPDIKYCPYTKGNVTKWRPC
jgi:hypothetical protein